MRLDRVVPAVEETGAGHIGLGRQTATFRQLPFGRDDEAIAHGVFMRMTDRSDRRSPAGFLTIFEECE